MANVDVDGLLDLAAEWLSTRNRLVKLGSNPNGGIVNRYEEKAANAVSRAKRG